MNKGSAYYLSSDSSNLSNLSMSTLADVTHRVIVLNKNLTMFIEIIGLSIYSMQFVGQIQWAH